MTDLWSKSTLSEPSNSIPVILVSQNTLGQALAHTGEDGDLEKHFDKAAELNPLDPNAILYKDGLFSAPMGLDNYEAALDLIEEIISQFPKTGNRRGFKAPVMGYLNKGATEHPLWWQRRPQISSEGKPRYHHQLPRPMLPLIGKPNNGKASLSGLTCSDIELANPFSISLASMCAKNPTAA